MSKTLVLCALLAGFAGGCYAHARGYVVSEPYVVYTEPGVYVVADASQPLYYEDGVYWRYASGVWVWSNVRTGEWHHGRTPPARLRAIRDPGGYAARARVRGRRVRADHLRREPARPTQLRTSPAQNQRGQPAHVPYRPAPSPRVQPRRAVPPPVQYRRTQPSGAQYQRAPGQVRSNTVRNPRAQVPGVPPSKAKGKTKSRGKQHDR